MGDRAGVGRPAPKSLPKGNRRQGSLDQKGKHRQSAPSKIGGTRATLPPIQMLAGTATLNQSSVGGFHQPRRTPQRSKPWYHAEMALRIHAGPKTRSSRETGIHPESSRVGSVQFAVHSAGARANAERPGRYFAGSTAPLASRLLPGCLLSPLPVQASPKSGSRVSSQFQNSCLPSTLLGTQYRRAQCTQRAQ